MSLLILFVDDDPFILEGLRRVLYCVEEDWDTEFASSASEALELLADDDFDAVVSDMRMPGMDGFDLLRQVRERHPDVIRLVLSGQADNETAIRSFGPAHQFLSKPCNPESLIGAIGRVLGVRERLQRFNFQQILTPHAEIEEMSGKIGDWFRELEGRRSGTSMDFTDLVASNEKIAQLLIALVNSPSFNLSTTVTDVHHALSVITAGNLRPAVLACAIMARISGLADVEMGECASILRHGQAVATRACAIVADAGAGSEWDYAYFAGLVHDFAKPIMKSIVGSQEYQAALLAAPTLEKSQCEIEEELTGTCHARLGAYLLSTWGLPAPVVEAVYDHHEVSAPAPPQPNAAIGVQLGNALENRVNRSQVEEGSGTRHNRELNPNYLNDFQLNDRVNDWLKGTPVSG